MEAMQVGTPVLVALIATALLFDFLNGLHDSANSIATVVSTRVLKPLPAVLLASFFNFIAFAVFGLHVANTMGNGVVSAGIVDPLVVFGALSGAIFWNVLTWWLGLPSSSSHALVGGLVGAGMAKAGPAAVIWGGLGTIGSAIVLSPLVGFGLALLLVLVVSWLSVRSTPFAVDGRFRVLQLVSSSLLSLGHGGNDAQKTMGIIAVLLLSQGRLQGGFHVPFWVVLSCQSAMALGTMAGGWRIVRTMGSRITHLTPMQGFCAETGGAAALFGATLLGVPVSTTHTIAGSIVGVGAARRVSAVRWGVARGIVVAWVITLPAAAVVGAACYTLTALLMRR
ncbi:MAG TPA: inorganic phosphate transporter [Acetobacteraceae bacterium]